MPDQQPKLYNLKKTTVVFAVASIVLLASLVGMVLQDSIRDWKHYQRGFMKYSREKAERELEAAKKGVDFTKLEALKKELEAAHSQARQNKKDAGQTAKEVQGLEIETLKFRTAYQDLKQVQDSDRYFYEEAQIHGRRDQAGKFGKRLAPREEELNAAKRRLEEKEAELEQKKAALEKFYETEKNLKRDMEKMTQDVSRLEKKIQSLKPGLAKMILDAPMLDFLKPTLQIQQVVLEDLYDDFYFTKSKKVDRCVTCHLGIDQKGFEDAPQPFRAHPRLDLFLSADSPHPLEEIGCTVCHGGSGHSSNFVTAAHTPRDEAQAKAWKKKYHWTEMKHWADKMLPLQYAEASCAKCHSGVVEVPEAPKLNEGRKLASVYGCLGCHKVEGMERWKAGPSLLRVQSKLEQDWIVRWLHNPKEFRPSTKMPRIFHLSNTSDDASAEKNNAAIAGIATYLTKNSEAVELQKPSAQGNPEAGKRLVEEIGCLGCHSVGDKTANDHGPELSNLGSKVTAEWLYTWLKDPKHYWPSTRMPNLRLSDQEAADITGFLLSQRNEKFDSLRPPHIKPDVVDDLAMTFLTGTMRFQEAQQKLGQMTAEAKLEFIGEKSIAHQGCFACHDIKGFDSAKLIGTELTEEGSKDVHRLDFGYVHIEHTRQAWFTQKLKEPRIFDKGKVKPYHEKLRMPQFDFADAEIEALTTFLLSLQKAGIPLQMQRRLDGKERETEAGRLVVEKLNCQGCHTLDGKEGRVRRLFQELGNAPPVLDGEGKKVQPHWLAAFLHAPTTIRPWLKYRMPTFGLKEEELTVLVTYFQNLAGAKPDFLAGKAIETSPEKLEAGQKLFPMFQCIKCHKSEPEPGLTASFLAPDLVIAKDRLRPEWVVDWLKDPQQLQPGTMMPTFFADGQSPVPDILGGDYTAQSEALRDYLWNFTEEEARILTQPGTST